MGSEVLHPMARPVRSGTVLHSFERVQGEVEARLAAVKPEQLAEPTHLPGWDVRTLAGHLIHVDLRYAAMADRRPEPPPDAEVEQSGGVPELAAALQRAGEHAVLAFARPGMLHEEYDSPWGPVPGYVLVQHVVNELLAHGWDLARATGQPTDLAPKEAAEVLDVVRQWYADLPRGEGLPFGPEQPVRESATAADRLAAYLGRSVSS